MYKKILLLLEGRDFKILLSFLLALIVVPSIFNSSIEQLITLNILFTLVFLISCNCLLFDLKLFYWSILFGIASILLTWLPYLNGFPDLVFAKHISYILFLFLLIKHILKTLFQAKEIDLNIVFAALSGYIIIGLIGCFMMLSLENIYPDAYSYATSDEPLKYYDYIYFSFVNLTTLGFGDILPKKDAAKGLTVLLTLIGQLYMSVIVAMMVGKYINYH